ncbi:MAG TPA: CsiV family protein [Nitrococcus sp.]|nr:CsiV family protein [Nitrococcus sp.]
MNHRPRSLGKKHVLIALLGLMLTVLGAPGVAAQNKYAVEVVIFRHWIARGDDAEFWLHQPPPISPSRHLVTLGPAASGTAAPAFSRLPDKELKLTGISERLAHSRDYHVLLHLGWQQPGFGPASAPAVVLPLDWSPPSLPKSTTIPPGTARDQNPFAYVPADTRLWGTLRLIEQRYLHFQVDLRFRGDSISAIPGDTVTVYPMIQNRRMRIGEIHYLDHPVLGILVQVRRLSSASQDNHAQAAR